MVHRNFKEIKYSIRPRLVPAGRVEPDWVSRPFAVEDLAITYVIDLGTRLKPVTGRHLATWKIDGDRLHRESLASFKALFGSGRYDLRLTGTTREGKVVIVHPHQQVARHANIILIMDLFLDSLRQKFGSPEKLLAAIPTTNRCWFLRADDLETRNRLQAELRQDHREGEHPLLDRYLIISKDDRVEAGPPY